jgi:predicted permease
MFAEWLTTSRLKLKALLKRRQLDRDLEEELQFHLAMREQKNKAAGLASADAHDSARRAFGNPTSLREICREMWTFVSLETWWQDIRYGARMLNDLSFSVVAVLTLALGLGATTAIFSVANAVLVRGLPFHDSTRLAALFQSPNKSQTLMGWAASGPDIVDWRRDSRSLASIAASVPNEATVIGASSPERVLGEKVTANYFDLLGAQASLGRTFAQGEDEPGRDTEVILSYALWRRIFGGQNILGRAIQLDDRTFSVIGVMPAIFHDPRTWMNPQSEYWIPLPRTQLEANRGEHMYAAFGRLARNVTFQSAQREMDVIGDRDAKQFPNTNEGFGVRVSPLEQVNLQTIEDGQFRSVAPAILLLQLAAGFLLLIACANVANLMLSRLEKRRTEMALRSALGGRRWRLIRQLLTESTLLAVLAGVVGTLLAFWWKNVLVKLAPTGYLPPTANISLDLQVLGFTLAVSTLTGLVFGIFPALQAVRQNLSEELKGSAKGTGHGPSKAWVRRSLVVFELAATFLLLVGGGLMTRSLASLLAVNPGFNPRDFFTAGLSLSPQRYSKPEQILRFFSAVQDRVQSLPTIDAVAFTSSPEFANNSSSDIVAEGESAEESRVGAYSEFCVITPNFFRAAGIRFLQGRDFSPEDARSGRKIAIVTQAFAARYWPHQNPIGKRLRYGGEQNGWREVVGLVGDVHQMGLAAPSDPEVYLPLTPETADGETAMNIVARSSEPPALLAREIEKQAWALDGSVPVSNVRTGDQILADWAGYLRYRTVLLGSFAVVALLIAAIGVFGVMAYTTAQRTHEIGIRLALGAQPRDVLGLLVFQGALFVFLGLLIGMGGALALTRLMRNLLYSVSPSDPLTFFGVAVLLAFVALVACYIPARRAMRVDPMVALRYE